LSGPTKPWITSIYNGISYGLNTNGDLVIKDTLGNVMFVADYQGGPNVPLSEQTAGIFVGRGQFKSSRLLDLTRPFIEQIPNIFKFGNEIAFVRTGHAFFPGNDDPLVLDLAGDGFRLTGESSAAPMFDMHGTGFAVHTGWLQDGLGFLVVEDAAGLVHNVRQLVGSANNSGFAALTRYDDNHDGVIDEHDDSYSQLMIWQDANGDAVAQPAELETLAQVEDDREALPIAFNRVGSLPTTPGRSTPAVRLSRSCVERSLDGAPHVVSYGS